MDRKVRCPYKSGSVKGSIVGRPIEVTNRAWTFFWVRLEIGLRFCHIMSDQNRSVNILGYIGMTAYLHPYITCFQFFKIATTHYLKTSFQFSKADATYYFFSIFHNKLIPFTTPPHNTTHAALLSNFAKAN